ncbi:MAG: UDP-N-acetylmuramoyl-tripeptide--D-alanyl-D-alanine ligase [Candidatus Omnitrophica bacterium]|nr:UDP-N-acetylmuramoyl-tripeptide--D-alanyl-D-alanine ligase [Candidatus Omnitrophota bacterium]
MSWAAENILETVHGRLIQGDPGRNFDRVVIDSRVATPNDLFVALPGRRFDGHKFLQQVAGYGGAGVLVAQGRASEAAGIPWVAEVPETLQALGQLAHLQRRTLRAPVFAIAGSSGKTTTKEMLAHILKERRSTVASIGTQNNAIGVPLTLLRACAEDEVVVVEAGTNHFGELDHLGRMIEPTVSVITGIGPAHLEFFGSLEGVARAKWELIEAMGPVGTAVLNMDDPYLRNAAVGWPGRIVWFGTDRKADILVEPLAEEAWGIRGLINRRYPIRLPLPGQHNLLNAAAAIACAQMAGIEPSEAALALASMIPPRGRLERQIVGGVRFINDAYNANPASARSAVEALLQWAGPNRRFIVFGDMRELGNEGNRYHSELGAWMGQLPIDGLLTLGSLAQHLSCAARASGLSRIWHCNSVDELGGRLGNLLQPGDVVLIKGSRAMQMERVIQCYMSSSTR